MNCELECLPVLFLHILASLRIAFSFGKDPLRLTSFFFSFLTSPSDGTLLRADVTKIE
jgi:hypothetical protein